ncbi:MAG: hypothetical protein ABI882_20905, partial [Acidobacteriota bacterium]
MNLITDGGDALSAQARLMAALGNSPWLLTTDLMQPVSLDSSRFEVRVEWDKLFFYCWNEEFTQVWRVTALEIASGTVRMLVSSGPARTAHLVTLWQPEQNARQMRAVYVHLVRQLLIGNDHRQPGRSEGSQGRGCGQVVSATIGADRYRQIRRGYARLVLNRDGATVLALGVSRHEDQEQIDGAVEAGIIWASRFNQTRVVDERARELIILLPRDRSHTVVDRLTLIATGHLGISIRCLEIDEDRLEITAIPIAAQMELYNPHPRRLTWPVSPSIELGDSGSSSLRSRMMALAPELIEVRPSIDGRGERFMINGLEF